MFQWTARTLVVIITYSQLVKTENYNDCIGPPSECCQKGRYELYGDDVLTLTSKYFRAQQEWCDQVIIVRRNTEKDDECNGCTLTIEFNSGANIDGEYGPSFELDLLEANYSSRSYHTSEKLFLNYLARYNATRFIPETITSTGNLIRVQVSQFNAYISRNKSIYFSMKITPNIPQVMSSEWGIFLSVFIPITVIFIFSLALALVVHRARRRRIALLRRGINQRLSRVILAALVEREMRSQEMRQQPTSPDPRDSIEPPSYSEAAQPPPDFTSQPQSHLDHRPPSYEEVVGNMHRRPSDTNSDVDPINIELEDSAGLDNGTDTARLVV